MESIVAGEIDAVQDVLVAGHGRAYMACVLVLKMRPGSEELDEPALQFAREYGSAARTVDEARHCKYFRYGLLVRFSACNKLVYERSKAQGRHEKPKQLRRFMIVSESFHQVPGGMHEDGSFNRTRMLLAFSEQIDSMYEAVDALLATPSRPPYPSVTSPASDSSVSMDDARQEASHGPRLWTMQFSANLKERSPYDRPGANVVKQKARQPLGNVCNTFGNYLVPDRPLPRLAITPMQHPDPHSRVDRRSAIVTTIRS